MKSRHRISFFVYLEGRLDREFLARYNDESFENDHQRNEYSRRLILQGFALRNIIPSDFMTNKDVNSSFEYSDSSGVEELTVRFTTQSVSDSDSVVNLEDKIWIEVRNRISRSDRKDFIRNCLLFGFLLEQSFNPNSVLKKYMDSDRMVIQVPNLEPKEVLEPAVKAKPLAAKLLGNLM